jgi:hypothetical protein
VSLEDGDEHPVSAFAFTELHPEIISHFSGHSLAECAGWVSHNTGGYQKDEIAHLGFFSGFRIPIKNPEDGVHYLQVYSTEKNLSYRVDTAQKSKRTSVHKALSNWQGERQNHFIPLQTAFTRASATHSVAVRIESRVFYENYPTVHYRIDDELICKWFGWVNNSAYW